MRVPRGDVQLRVERDELEGVAHALLRFEEEGRAESSFDLPLLDERVDEERDVHRVAVETSDEPQVEVVAAVRAAGNGRVVEVDEGRL